MQLTITYRDNTTQVIEITDMNSVQHFGTDLSIKGIRVRNLTTNIPVILDAADFQSAVITDSTGKTTEITLSQLRYIQTIPLNIKVTHTDQTIDMFTNVVSPSIKPDWFTVTTTNGTVNIPRAQIYRIQLLNSLLNVVYLDDTTSQIYCNEAPLTFRQNDGILLSQSQPYLAVTSLEIVNLILVTDINGNLIKIPEYKVKTLTTS
jgi:PII-like signaling protein